MKTKTIIFSTLLLMCGVLYTSCTKNSGKEEYEEVLMYDSYVHSYIDPKQDMSICVLSSIEYSKSEKTYKNGNLFEDYPGNFMSFHNDQKQEYLIRGALLIGFASGENNYRLIDYSAPNAEKYYGVPTGYNKSPIYDSLALAHGDTDLFSKVGGLFMYLRTLCYLHSCEKGNSYFKQGLRCYTPCWD